MLRRWFDTKGVDDLADNLARSFVRHFRDSAAARKPHGGSRAYEGALRELNSQAIRYAAEHGLGFFRKARLGNRLTWSLKEAGYPDDLIDTVVREMLLAVSLASRGGTKADGR